MRGGRQGSEKVTKYGYRFNTALAPLSHRKVPYFGTVGQDLRNAPGTPYVGKRAGARPRVGADGSWGLSVYGVANPFGLPGGGLTNSARCFGPGMVGRGAQ